jgi:hypothetical protein
MRSIHSMHYTCGTVQCGRQVLYTLDRQVLHLLWFSFADNSRDVVQRTETEKFFASYGDYLLICISKCGTVWADKPYTQYGTVCRQNLQRM